MHFNACYSGQIRNVYMPPTQTSHRSVSVQNCGRCGSGEGERPNSEQSSPVSWVGAPNPFPPGVMATTYNKSGFLVEAEIEPSKF